MAAHENIVRARLAPFMRKIVVNIGLVIGSVLLSLLGVELVLRTIGFSDPVFLRLDSATGSWHQPGASGWWRREGEAFITINADGLRDRDHLLAAPAGVFRIAILGDSFAEAMQVPL